VRLKFWGVRGSTPTPERRNSRYGGNTPCLEIALRNGTILIFDCGSGMRGLGKSLLRCFGKKPIVAYIFLSHFHWDHIQGIPFFLPLYRKGNSFFFHSVSHKGRELKNAVEGQMATPYFPVDMSIMGAVRHFYDIGTEPIDINGAIINSLPLHHPQGSVGYRIEADGGILTYATDTEPGSAVHDRNVRTLARDADTFIYDAQYTPAQLRGEKKGWGHSTWVEGTKIAREAGARQLVLFHHEPDHDDAMIDSLLAQARAKFPRTIAAAEGMVLEIPAPPHGPPTRRPGRRANADAHQRS
jgi:phosphoribosyl 1,2-cyclic phosphodiesterase